MKTFSEPELEVIRFTLTDVITTSGDYVEDEGVVTPDKPF
jgi:hypothetical protein